MLINGTILPQEQQYRATARTTQPTPHKYGRKIDWYFQGPLHLRNGNSTLIVAAAFLVPPNTIGSHNNEPHAPIAHKPQTIRV